MLDEETIDTILVWYSTEDHEYGTSDIDLIALKDLRNLCEYSGYKHLIAVIDTIFEVNQNLITTIFEVNQN